MKTFKKSSAMVAVLGVTGLVLHTSDSDMIASRVAADAIAASSGSVGTAAEMRSGYSVERSSSTAGAGDLAVLDSFDVPSLVPVAAPRRASAGERTTPDREVDPDSKLQAARAKMSGPVAALAAAGGAGKAEIIVSYHEHPDLFEDGRVEALGGQVLRRYEVLDLLAIRIPAESLVELAVEDDVKRLSLDEVVMAGSTSMRPASNTPKYPSGNVPYKGSSQTVAILDTGVAKHSDLSDSYLQYTFLNGAYPVPDIGYGEVLKAHSSPRVDGYGHGTHIAGIIAGNGYASGNTFRGPATGANILSLQVLDENGHGQMSDVMAALDWLVQFGDNFGVTVANLSLGKPITESYTTDPLVAAVEAVWDSGIVVVVASGNYGREGYFSVTSPGNSRKVITVGSLTDNGTGGNFDDDYVSTYSSRGPTAADHVVKPDIVAPGNRLVAASAAKSNLETLLPGNVVACTVASDCKQHYIEMSGTSMATGVVAAAAAMMLHKDPSLTPATVKARLMRSARKLNESPVVAGAGLLDIDAAMNETGIVTGEALSPLMDHDAATGGTLIQDTAGLWGDDLWGAGYLWTDSIAASGYLWTDGGISASGYLWTDGGIWANGYLWTDGGIAAFGYLWTDGVAANGYLWTDGGIGAKGYLWTDGGGFQAMSLYDLYDESPALNDDDHSSN